MGKRSNKSIATFLGLASTSSALMPQATFAAPSEVCTVQTPTDAQVTAITVTNPAVSAADVALATAQTFLATKKTLEVKALTNYQKALKTPSKADDAALLRAYQNAKQARINAEAAVSSAQSRLVAARQSVKDQVNAQYNALCKSVVALQISVLTSSDQVKLAWNAIAGATAYIVSRDGQDITTTDGRNFVDSDVHNSTTYNYSVTAIAALGAGQNISLTQADVVATPVLPKPTGLQAKQIGTHVHLTWNPSAHATKYNVFRDNELIADTVATEYDDNSLGGTYQIQAVEDSIQSAKSTSVRLTIVISLDQPENVVAVPGNKSVALSWDEVENATGYRIIRNGTTLSTTSTPSYVDNSVTNGTTYFYRVVATNGKFESLASVSVTATPIAPLTPPSSPTGLIATAGNAQIALSWQSVSGATTYKIFRDSTLLASVSGTSFTDSTAVNGTLYNYAIKASNLAGDSLLSTSVSATPTLPVAPNAPTGLSAAIFDKKVTLTWNAVSGATSYQVYRDGILVASPATTTFNDTAVTNGTTYSYTVKALNLGGSSIAGDAVSAKPMPPVPSAPTNLSANATNSQVSLSWSVSLTATSYKLYRDGSLLATPVTSSFIDTTVINGTTYTYTVKAVNGSGDSNSSNSAIASPIAPPETPTNVVPTAGNAQVSLNWTPSATATNYKIYRNDVLLVSTQLTTYVDKSVINGTTYSYAIKAINAGGESPASSPITAKPEISAPSAPLSVVATAGNSKVTLTWATTATAVSYKVYRDESFLATSATTTYVDNTAVNGTTYAYKISAVNAGGESAQSTSASATPSLPPAPNAPTNLQATAGNGQVSLSWGSVATSTSYKVYRDGTLLASPITNSFVDITAVNGTTYSYTVSAINEGGESVASSATSATPQVSAPSAPTGLAATAGDTQVSLSWNTSSGATSYKVYRGGVLLATQSGTSFTDTGLSNGTLYFYTVKASNAGGDSSASSTVSATPQIPAPSAPTNLQATAGNASVSLSWTASVSATSYKVLRNGVQIGTTTNTSYSDSTAMNGTTYSYTVKAVNAGGDSVASSSASATPQVPAPSAPTNLQATAGDKSVSLSWSASATATSYKIYRGATLLATQSGTTYTDTGLTNGTLYSYTVKASNAGGDSVASNSASATPIAVVVTLATPTGLTANTATSLNTGAFRLSWTAVSGATSYTIYKNGTVLGTSATTTYTPASTALGSTASYTVMATNGTAAQNSNQSAALTAGVYQGSSVNDQWGRTVYGQIQVYIIVNATSGKSVTGCWATYPTSSDSGPINNNAIPKLCSSVLTVQPTSANATTSIASVSGASATSPAFRTSLANALSQAGL